MGNVLGMDGVRMVAVLFMMMCLVVNGQTTSSSPCSISADKNSEDLEQALELGYHMLFMIFSFSNVSRTIPISVDTPQPFTWVHVSGNHGKGLIWLRQNFEVLSLTSLRYGVHDLDINLSDNPEGCLSTKPASDIANDVRDFILNNFADPVTNITWIGKEVCNARFREHETGTEVYFVCCKKDDLFKTTCYELKRNKWMNIFFLCILVLPLIALMFAPLMIPFDLFRDNGNDIFFQHKVDSELNIHITKRSKEQHVERSKLEINEKYFKDMPRFCETLATLDDNQRYDCTLEKIHFYVERENLIGKDVDPFGPFTMLYDMLARYELRRRGFSEGNSCREYVRILSGKILNTGYLLLIIILVNIPVIARLAFFFTYTYPDWFVVNSLESLNLNSNLIQYSSFGVRIIPRLELYLIYLVLIGLFVLVQFFKIRGTRRVDVVIEILKQCLRDSRKRRIKLAFQTIYKACRSVVNQSSIKGWLLAFVYFVLFLPFVVFSFVFYLLPTVNLVCSIPSYLFTYVLSNNCGCLSRSRCVRAIAKYLSDGLGLNPIFLNQTDGGDPEDDDNDDDSNKLCSPADMLIILILVCTLPFVIFVVLDCISFYIDIFIYVLIGLLLNASFTTKYVILSLMLAFYIRDLFEGVTKSYIKFNNTIITEAMKKTRGDILKVSLLNENLQKNTVFQLIDETPLGEPDAQQESVSPSGNFKLTYEEGNLSWKTKRLMFFLDRKDTSYIPRKFFSEACVMDCVGIPGPLDQNLIDVINNILRIFSFLFFIMLIALAFSEESGSLGTNQTLAAIAGGLVPWLFRKYLQAPEDAGVDIENLHFREVFNDLIRKYKESWTVADIEIANVQVSADQPVTVTDIEGGEIRDQSGEKLLKAESFSSLSETVEPESVAKDEVPGESSAKKEKNAYEPETKTTRQNSQSDNQDHLIVLVNRNSSRSLVV
ncbi:uncharacterized protein LOC110441190 [Mizuhopecten yessoensis]|uniref:Uncharacterized protein n=1 Tax=Mizuhopecten yessoensis TaxID=6573 RepID=A0A210PJT2_MIZYE|nr:uncharacterized protein LOC110441190 [Mizuhopecten yessoensis]OWF36751.1 hypothetical protein KP79_PYT02917 [Mizuhopecten yessoensis]